MKNLINKLIAVLVTVIIITFQVNAQSPEAFNYQAMALNASDMPYKNQSIRLQITLLESNQNGPTIYVERHNTITSDKGLFSFQIGTGTIQAGSFSDADWGSENYWIKVEADFNGGNNYTDLGTTQLVSVPYAMHAQTVENADDADADPNNEIQFINKAGNVVNLSLGGGSFIDEVDDADSDVTNEIQSLSRNGSTILLSKNGGSFLDMVDDADNNPNNEIQFITKSGDLVTLSNGGGQYIDEVNDADADATNEIQKMSINGNKITLSNGGGTINLPARTVDTDDQKLSLKDTKLTIEDGNTVNLFEISSPWVRDTFPNIINFEDANGVLARIRDDFHTLNLSHNEINYKDTSECRTYLDNGSLIYDREITLAPDLRFITPVAGFSKDSIYFYDFDQNSNDISHSMMSKNISYFYDEIGSQKFEGSLEPFQLDLRINNTEAWGNYDAYGIQARAEAVPGISRDWEIDLKTGFGLYMAEDDGNNRNNASLSNQYGIQIGKGITYGEMEEVRTKLNQDSLIFDYFVDNGFQSGFAHYGRDDLSMKFQAGPLANSSCMSASNLCIESDLAGEKISMNMNWDNIEFDNPNGGFSFTHVGLDSIFMNKTVGLLYPDAMTLKPHQLMFDNPFNQSFFDSRGLQIKTIISPSDIFTQIDLQPDALTMYNSAKWKNISLGTQLDQNAGKLDIWSGTGDFKLVELGSDNLDGLAGSLELFSHNSGAHSQAWLRIRDNHGELTLDGPSTLNVLIGARNDEGGLVQVYDAAGNGTASASMFADNQNRGILQSNHVYVGQHPGDNAVFPLKVVQTAQYGINLESSDNSNNWEQFVNGSNLELYANAKLVGRFDAVTGAYTALSDKRFKTNIQAMNGVLSTLMLMKPSKYEYINNNTSSKKSIGFIAQDLQNLFPELVLSAKSKEGNEVLTVDYAGFGVIAIKAIQEQQTMIDNQAIKINKLEDEMKKLKMMVETMMNKK